MARLVESNWIWILLIAGILYMHFGRHHGHMGSMGGCGGRHTSHQSQPDHHDDRIDDEPPADQHRDHDPADMSDVTFVDLGGITATVDARQALRGPLLRPDDHEPVSDGSSDARTPRPARPGRKVTATSLGCRLTDRPSPAGTAPVGRPPVVRDPELDFRGRHRPVRPRQESTPWWSTGWATDQAEQ